MLLLIKCQFQTNTAVLAHKLLKEEKDNDNGFNVKSLILIVTWIILSSNTISI